MSVFTLDGKGYPGIHVNDLERSFSILDGDNAGRLMNGDMTRDIVGTYYNYKMAVEADYGAVKTYDELYEAISAPVDSHVLTVPYGQEELTFKAYVTSGNDKYNRINNLHRWSGLTISFVAMSPQRRPL